jgi:serine/threonine protein kinase
LVNVTEKLEHIKLVQDMIHGAVMTDETLATVVALKALSIDLDAPKASPISRQAPIVQRRLIQQVHNLTTGQTSATAIYEGKPVFIERKRYAESDVSGPNAILISKGVQGLALLLNAPKPLSFRTLRCIGITNDSLKLEYQFVFDRPPHSTTNVPPRSLLSFLRSSFIPSQTDRFRLATELATTLLHLHASGWLHKGLRSDNILFFSPSPDAPRTLDEPYIMGYEYARHDQPGELSQKPSQNPAHDVYRHPRAQGPVSSTRDCLLESF